MSDKLVIDLAVIIPTLNEEHFIGRMLDSIIRQTVAPKEVVVVDAHSQDQTVPEIKKRQAKLGLQYFRIPQSTIARQRNFGAKKTASPHLLFLDADMELRGKDDLEKYFKEVMEEKPGVAAAPNLPDSTYWKDVFYFKTEDLLIKLFKHFWPVVTARNLYVRRKVFNKAGGFDDSIAVGEDQELVHRIIKGGGKLTLLKTVKLHTSTRRVEHEGRTKYSVKMILFGLSIMLFGHKRSRVKYDFGKFKNP